MLRITVHEDPGTLTFQLEGSLAEPCLRSLVECWLNTLGRRYDATLRVDLTGVTYIDAAAKEWLEAMHRQGAEFIAADCHTRAIVAEITQSPRTKAECARKEPSRKHPNGLTKKQTFPASGGDHDHE